MDCLLGRGEGTNVEGENFIRPSLGWMGAELVDKRAGMWKSKKPIIF